MKIERSFEPCGDRYEFDFDRCTYAKGWAQIDTNHDAAWFGNWCNPTTFEMMQYVEGDITHTACGDEVGFVAAVSAFCASYDARIDPGLGENMAILFRKLGMGHLLHGG